MSGAFLHAPCRKAPRRALTALLSAALALSLVLAPLPGGPLASGEASAAKRKCGAKRVSKRHRRHTRARHAKRGKSAKRAQRRRACKRSPASAATPSEPMPTTPVPEPDPETPVEEPESNTLGVKSGEYYFVLSRPTVRAGEVTVELNNYGEDPHNLNLQREAGGEAEPVLQIPVTGSLGRSSESFDLPAGSYRLWCSLPGHAALGMEATLVVE